MTARRARLSLLLFPLLVVLAVVVASLPSTTHKDAVGTDGPRTPGPSDTVGHLAAGATPTTATTGTGDRQVTAGAAPSPATGSTPDEGTTAVPGASTTTVTSPTTTTTTSPATGPHDLLGRVVYLNQGGDLQVWSMRPDGSDRRAEVRCSTDIVVPEGVALSPDGEWLARTCGISGMDPHSTGFTMGRDEVLLQRVDGTKTVVLHDDVPALYPPELAFSPDGTQLAEVRLREVTVHAADGSLQQAGVQAITIDDLATGRSRILTPPSGEDVAYVTWNPDGTKLLTDHLLEIDLATGAMTRLRPHLDGFDVGDNYYSDLDDLASWSPDGAWVYYREVQVSPYATARDPLFRMSMTTGDVEVVIPDTDPPPPNGSHYFTGQLAFSPDGRIMTVHSGALWSMAADGSDLRVLADDFGGQYLTNAWVTT